MILTPWWKTRPFYLLLLFTVTGVTVFLIRYRTWKLKRDKEVLEQLVRTRTMEVENQKEQIRRQNEMLLQHGEKLEELVAERTKALTAAMEKAEESNRLKTAFLQNLSHEIRTPLNAIMGFSELLNNTDNSDEERNSYTHIIVNSSRQLLSIMHNILTISSIETGQEKMEKSVVLINGIVEETVQLFKNAADTKGIALRIEHPSSGYETQPIRASTDGYKLQQILLHLINNAIKYTHVGSVSVAYGLEGNRITFRITDTGIGIPPQQIDHIFDRFRKGDDPLTSEARGTGLGLSISKAYVELLGGTIRVTSEPGKGSSFYFTITPG
jgi:signal transduction histidine kinase